MSNTIQNENSKPAKKRVHIRTVAILFFFVVLPWVLIAIPADCKDGSMGDLVSYGPGKFAVYGSHGWPAVHGMSIKREGLGKTTSQSTNVYRNYSEMLKPQQVLDMTRYRHFNEQWFQPGFWSNIDRWPTQLLSTSPGGPSSVFFRYKTVWSGLLINFLFLSVACGLVGAVIEHRIRRYGTLFRLSITQSIVVMGLICVSLAWCTKQVKTGKHQQAELEKLRSLSVPQKLVVEVSRKDAVPNFVARLFDYQTELVPEFRSVFLPISDVVIYSRRMNREDFHELAQIDLPLHVFLSYTQLLDLQPDNIVGLNFPLLFTEQLQHLERFTNLKNLSTTIRLYEQGLDFDLDVLSKIKSLEHCKLNLDFGYPVGNDKAEDWQQPYLEEVIERGVPGYVSLSRLNQKGAEYLLSQGPIDREIYISFSGMPPAQEISDETKKKLLNLGFLEGSHNPAVLQTSPKPSKARAKF